MTIRNVDSLSDWPNAPSGHRCASRYRGTWSRAFHAVEQGKHVLPKNTLDYPIRLVQFASSFGYIGVFLFFVISGFCIHLQ